MAKVDTKVEIAQKSARTLITGLPGIGKNELAKLARKAGINAVDADEYLKWGISKEQVSVDGKPLWWVFMHPPHWVNGLRQFLRGAKEKNIDTWVFGVSFDTPFHLHHFDKVIILRAPGQIIEDRLEGRDSNYGTTFGQRKFAVVIGKMSDVIVGSMAKMNKKFVILDATKPPVELLEEIKKITGQVR